MYNETTARVMARCAAEYGTVIGMRRMRTPSRPHGGMDALRSEAERRGLAVVTRECGHMIRDAWPYRTTDQRAAVVIRANVRTLRDLRYFVGYIPA